MSINADWQDVLAAVALAASEKQVASSIPPVMPPELPRVIMRAAHAAEMGATTGPLWSEDRMEQSAEAANRHQATARLAAKATDSDEKAFWTAESNENAYRSIALCNNVLDPDKLHTHSIAFAAQAHIYSLQEMDEHDPARRRTTDGEMASVGRCIQDFQEETRSYQGGLHASLAVRPAPEIPLTEDELKEAVAVVVEGVEELDPAADEAFAAEARADAALEIDMAELNGSGEAESGQTDADWMDDDEARGFDDYFAPPADEIKATPAEIRAALVEMEGVELAEAEAVPAAEEATPPDVFNPQPEHRYLVYSNREILPPTPSDPTGGFDFRAWGTGATRDEARDVAEIVGRRELSGERLEQFLDALGDSRLPSNNDNAEIKTMPMTPALAQHLADRYTNGATSIPSWRLTPDGKALGIGGWAAWQQIANKIRQIEPQAVEHAVETALFNMRPDAPGHAHWKGMHLPAAVRDVAREHLTAIANAARSHAVEQLGPAMAGAGAANAIRSSMFSGKVEAYTKPVADLASAIQNAGEGRLSVEESRAIGRATAAHLLNTLFREVGQCAAVVAPELGVKAPKNLNLDTRSVVHGPHSETVYTPSPLPPPPDCQSQERGGQSR